MSCIKNEPYDEKEYLKFHQGSLQSSKTVCETFKNQQESNTNQCFMNKAIHLKNNQICNQQISEQKIGTSSLTSTCIFKDKFQDFYHTSYTNPLLHSSNMNPMNSSPYQIQPVFMPAQAHTIPNQFFHQIHNQPQQLQSSHLLFPSMTPIPNVSNYQFNQPILYPQYQVFCAPYPPIQTTLSTGLTSAVASYSTDQFFPPQQERQFNVDEMEMNSEIRQKQETIKVSRLQCSEEEINIKHEYSFNQCDNEQATKIFGVSPFTNMRRDEINQQRERQNPSNNRDGNINKKRKINTGHREGNSEQDQIDGVRKQYKANKNEQSEEKDENRHNNKIKVNIYLNDQLEIQQKDKECLGMLKSSIHIFEEQNNDLNNTEKSQLFTCNHPHNPKVTEMSTQQEKIKKSCSYRQMYSNDTQIQIIQSFVHESITKTAEKGFSDTLFHIKKKSANKEEENKISEASPNLIFRPVESDNQILNKIENSLTYKRIKVCIDQNQTILKKKTNYIQTAPYTNYQNDRHLKSAKNSLKNSFENSREQRMVLDNKECLKRNQESSPKQLIINQEETSENDLISERKRSLCPTISKKVKQMMKKKQKSLSKQKSNNLEQEQQENVLSSLLGIDFEEGEWEDSFLQQMRQNTKSGGKSFFLVSNYKRQLIQNLDQQDQQIVTSMKKSKKFNFSKNVIKQFLKVVSQEINYIYKLPTVQAHQLDNSKSDQLNSKTQIRNSSDELCHSDQIQNSCENQHEISYKKKASSLPISNQRNQNLKNESQKENCNQKFRGRQRNYIKIINPPTFELNLLHQNIKKFLTFNSYTHSSIKKIMVHPYYSLYFSDFLENHSEEWVESGKTKYKMEQTIMIAFLKLCLRYHKLLIFLSQHDTLKEQQAQQRNE